MTKLFQPLEWLARGFRSQQRRLQRGFVSLLTLGGLIAILAHPGQAAISAQISPANPELGDTLSVVVPSSVPPVVSFGGRDYPAFAIGGHRLAPCLDDVAGGELRAVAAQAVVARRGHQRDHRRTFVEAVDLRQIAAFRRGCP
ncbi:MAG: hypothetical protein HC860_20365, partial [Alkalinema sp. RU_4_3]|nr:hypothetical protein [Alkalinema sp. RU_4_3]